MKNYTLQSRPLAQASKAFNTKPAIRTKTRPAPPPPSQTSSPDGCSIPTAGTPPVLTKKFQTALSRASGAGDKTPLVHMSIDRDKTGGHVFAALGLGQAHDLGKRSLEEFHHLIGHLGTQGWKLIVVQESCGFGYELHRTLAAMPGVEALIVHCQPLSGKRKTDRRGDPHLRALMTELVWRLRKFQPQWRGFVKFAAILGPESKAGRPARKKAITACVRLLFIDLWRLFTGQLQASAIGLN